MTSLWNTVVQRGPAHPAAIHGPGHSVRLADLAGASVVGGRLESLRDRSILLATQGQLTTAIALIELDGVARRLVLCTPEISAPTLNALAVIADADAVVVEGAAPPGLIATPYAVTPNPERMPLERRPRRETEWVLLTSGTTGTPKLVVHTLASLAGTLPRATLGGRPAVWSTFYDIRRYGGLQMYLRALLGGTSLVLSHAGESLADFLTRAAAAGVTHLSGTPSHWRKLLMSGEAARLTPEYVRLSGEIADQALLDALKRTYPDAQVSHAFASTEAGVAFEVDDGLAGFPADLVGAPGPIELKVEDGTLRIRSGRTAQRYLGDDTQPIGGSDGFVDTGDRVERQGGRYYFRGRHGGVINVGGLKVHPEEVEAVLNADARVRMSLVRGRRNPITGAVVVAEVVLAEPSAAAQDPDAAQRVRTELLAACRRVLPAHKVPAILHFVAALDMTAAGKLVRPGA